MESERWKYQRWWDIWKFEKLVYHQNDSNKQMNETTPVQHEFDYKNLEKMSSQTNWCLFLLFTSKLKIRCLKFLIKKFVKKNG